MKFTNTLRWLLAVCFAVVATSSSLSQSYPPIETKPKLIAQASKACDAGDMVQCHVYAQSILNLPYKKGGENYYDWYMRNGPQLIKAYAASEKACNSGVADACYDPAMYWIAIIQDINPNVRHDIKRGRDLLARGCDGGNANSCIVLQRLENPTPSAQELMTLIIPDNWAGTVYLNLFFVADGAAWLYDNTNQSDFPNSIRLKTVIRATSCEMGYLGACWSAANGYRSATGKDNLNKDMQRATEYALKGCDGGDGQACHSLGQIYFLIDGRLSDRSRAAMAKSISALEQLCANGEGLYCFELANFNSTNIGSRSDSSTISFYHQKGCANGFSASCKKLWEVNQGSQDYCDGLVHNWNAVAARTESSYKAIDARRAKTEDSYNANRLFAEMTSVKEGGCHQMLAIVSQAKFTCRAQYEDMLHSSLQVHSNPYYSCPQKLREMDKEYHIQFK